MTPSLALLLVLPVRGFLVVLGLLVLQRLLTGQITSRGLLQDCCSAQASALRVQTLIVTVVAGAVYAVAIAQTRDFSRLPALRPELIALAFGSNSLLLASRAAPRLLAALRFQQPSKPTRDNP